MARASFDVECLERIELALGSFEDARADPGLVQSLRDVVPQEAARARDQNVCIAELSLAGGLVDNNAACRGGERTRSSAMAGNENEMRCSDHAPVDRTEH